jgi:hypothetical protein
MATRVDGDAPSFRCMVAAACWLRRRLRAAPRLLRHRFSALLLVERARPSPVAMGMLGMERQSSPVEVARKSRELHVMRLPREKASPLANADDYAIRVTAVTWHTNDLLPGVATFVVSRTGGQ